MSQTEHHHHHQHHHHHHSEFSDTFKQKSLNSIKYRRLVKKWLLRFLIVLAVIMAAIVVYIYTVN